MDAGALPPAVRHFNPRPPRGGRRRQIPPPRQSTDFNPRPPRGGRRQIKKEGSRTAAISIHAPREGGDRSPAHPDGQKRDFNPRPPRGGRRRHICSAMSYSRFQSTPPARGATRHPLAATRGNFLFQSTPPARGATTTRPVSDIARRISIHAPREGGDNLLSTQLIKESDFNPRPPRGGRLLFVSLSTSLLRFQSTPPARGATVDYCHCDGVFAISIHAPREGGDQDPDPYAYT